MNDGVLLIDKPSGMTSFDVVAIVRRKLGVKCGHSGTLDPLATGLLPVLCGKATKLCSYLTDGDKEYVASMRFGFETDTLDSTGSTTATSEKAVTLSDIESVIPRFTGVQLQTPPAFSAIKVGGTALYKRARRGETVEVPPREIEIYDLEVLSYDGGVLVMRVRCSKGTYIRSLCRDIGRAVGSLGTMTALRRTETGGWTVENSVSPDSDDLSAHLISLDDALSRYPEFRPDPFFATLLSNGCAVETKKLGDIPNGVSRVYGDRLIGLGTVITDGETPTYKIITHL